jgi:hypothetical protein
MITPPRFGLFSRWFSRRALPAVSADQFNCDTAGRARRLNGLNGRRKSFRRGSVLIIVVALLVLMAVIGTAYVSTARTDRGAAATGSFNTEIDLLVQGVESMAQNAIVQDVTNSFWTANSTPSNFTSPAQQTFLSSRVPVMVNGSPGWMYLSAAPINNAVFESPYNQAGTSAAPAVLQYGTDRQNMQVSSVSVADANGMIVQYPALTDPVTGVTYLAASAAGDGIADSALFRLPIGEINGVTYYAAVRIIDNNSAVNASTAWADNNTNPNVQMTGNDIYGNFSPANVNLLNLVADGQTGMAALNNYRSGGPTGGTMIPQLEPYDDSGQPRNDFQFISPYDALWMQLGRRLGNPGYISGSAKYQALPMTECGTLAYHFCLPNSSSSSSMLEQYFPQSLRGTGMRTSPYAPSDFQNWYKQNFNYASEITTNTSTFLPRRVLVTARNGTSTFAPNKFTNKLTYSDAASYDFGDMVQLTGNPFNYICIQPTDANSGEGPAVNTSNAYWAIEPWTDHITKTPVNTATFDQLWLAYWNAMTDNAGNVPAGTDTAMFRNPIRASQSANSTTTTAGGGGTVGGSTGSGAPAGGTGPTLTPSGGDDTAQVQAAINASNSGDIITFTAGTYKISQTLTFLSGRTFLGAGAAGVDITTPPSLSSAETLKMRAAIAAANTQTLRGGGNNVVSQLVYLGVAASGGTTQTGAGSASGGVTTFQWTGGNSNFLMTTDTTAKNITIEGMTFLGAGIKIDGSANNVQLLGDSIQNISTNTQDGIFDTGLYIPGSFTNSAIEGCTISGMPDFGAEATQIYNCDQNTQITDNNFVNCWNGLHITFANQGQGTVVSRNICSQIGRNAIEIQGNPNGLTVSNNYVHNWVKQLGTPGDAHMAYSIATGGWSGTSTNGNNITISDNVAIGDGDPNMGTPPQPGINFTAFEIMGTNVTVSGNYTSNMGTAQLMDNATEPTTWSTSGNTWCGLTGCTNGQTTGSPVIDGNAPTLNIGNQTFISANAVPIPPLPIQHAPTIPSVPGSAPTTQPGGGATTQPSQIQLSAMVYGTARNPYITEVYADNDRSLPYAYVAVELYNPYNTEIPLTNWRLATLPRQGNSSTGLTLSPLPSTTAWTTNPPTIAAHGFLTLVSNGTPPTQYTSGPSGVMETTPPSAGQEPSSQIMVLPDLGSALDSELFLVRPRQANGNLTNDPNGTYNEMVNGQPTVPNVPDLVPVDSYDLTGIFYPSDAAGTPNSSNPAREWHYVRPNDPNAQKNWHFVYPGPYTPTTTGSANPCLTATQVGPPGTLLTTAGLTTFGENDASGNYQDVPLQIDNDQCPGPNPSAAANNLFPFGEFARNGDILHVTYIGSYRIQSSTIPSGSTAATVYELNPVTIDATYAKAQDPTQDLVIPGENIGRFTPIYVPSNSTSTTPSTVGTNDYSSVSTDWTPYHFTTQLFDYVTTISPVDWTPNALTPAWQSVNIAGNIPDSAYLPNVDPGLAYPLTSPPTPAYPGTAPQAVTTMRNSAQNPTSPTNDTVPLEGLININTAPWPVLATLPMVDTQVDNTNLAKAIAYFRDVDDGTGTSGALHPHGPFKSIWELNEVAVNTPSINGGTPMVPAGDPNFGGPQGISGKAISFLQTLGSYNTNNYNPATTAGSNEAGDISPQPSVAPSNYVYNDFESQNLALTRISNLITTRSDLYTVYVLVQGWRNVGTASPSLVVQRRAAFLADRNGITDTNKLMTITNIPNN